jgi:hypothetical protein
VTGARVVAAQLIDAAQAFELDFGGREGENVDCRHVVFQRKRSAVGSQLRAKVP